MFRRCVVTAFLSFAIAAPASPAIAGYLNGEEYLYLEDHERTIYVTGLLDMLEELGGANATVTDFWNRVERCTSGMSAGQLRDFVDNYMLSDPSFEQYTMASNFSAALTTSCPP